MLLLLLEYPKELCGGPGGVPAVWDALLELLTLPQNPPASPPRALLLLATVTVLLATGTEGTLEIAPFMALLLQEAEGAKRGGAPAAAAECLRELLRVRGPGDPPRTLPPSARRSLLARMAVASAVQPLVLLLAEGEGVFWGGGGGARDGKGSVGKLLMGSLCVGTGKDPSEPPGGGGSIRTNPIGETPTPTP